VVDDERSVRDALDRALRMDGYRVQLAADGREALDALAQQPPDAIVLDVLMPEPDGLEVCRRLRAAGDRTPVLMLTARDAVGDRVAGLDGGADDYLTKPFDVEELLARIRALDRRFTDSCDLLRLGAGFLDRQAHDVALADGTRVPLSPREFDLLHTLAARPRAIHSRSQLRAEVFPDTAAESVVDTYVYYLRRKLGRQIVRTVYGLGYRIGLL